MKVFVTDIRFLRYFATRPIQLLMFAPLIVLFLSAATASAAQTYHVNLIGDGNTYANSINSYGDIVGYSLNTQLGFLYRDGATTDIGLPFSTTRAIAINDNRQVVGYTSTDQFVEVAFRYESGTLTTLGTNGQGFSIAWGINNSGQIVGDAFGQAYFYSNGSFNALPSLGSSFPYHPSNYAYAINDSGNVVGESSITTSTYIHHAVLYSGGTTQDIGQLFGTTPIAMLKASTTADKSPATFRPLVETRLSLRRRSSDRFGYAEWVPDFCPGHQFQRRDRRRRP